MTTPQIRFSQLQIIDNHQTFDGHTKIPVLFNGLGWCEYHPPTRGDFNRMITPVLIKKHQHSINNDRRAAIVNQLCDQLHYPMHITGDSPIEEWVQVYFHLYTTGTMMFIYSKHFITGDYVYDYIRRWNIFDFPCDYDEEASS